MLLPSHLKISRHGVFNFRIVLPAPIAIAIGQREIKRSLHTRCPIEAKNNAYGLSARILPVIQWAPSARCDRGLAHSFSYSLCARRRLRRGAR